MSTLIRGLLVAAILTSVAITSVQAEDMFYIVHDKTMHGWTIVTTEPSDASRYKTEGRETKNEAESPSRAEACLGGGGGVGSGQFSWLLFAEQRKHLISHQVNRLCHAPNIDARLETLDAASKNGPHVGPGQNFSLNQMFKKRQGGHAIRDRNALIAAAEKIDHG